MTKTEIRRSMKEQRGQLSDEERRFLNEKIRERFLTTEEYRMCGNLFCYISFGSEVNTISIIQQALEEEKQVYVPKVEAQGMEFYRIEDLNRLQPSSFGVPEPSSEDTRRYPMDTTDTATELRLMLLPGLAFDPLGNRIGYGAGYYDRYLCRYPQKHFYKIAACYDFQLMEHITTEEYDIRADAILTPTKRIICG
jgi:5-formyltetrahydrofolate cyclo-ligase